MTTISIGTGTSSRDPGRALVVRVGALGDVLLTRRLTYSLSLAGFRTTLMAPGRHASLLLADPWIDAVMDSESPRYARAFAGNWPEDAGHFDVAIVISQAIDLIRATRSAATSLIQASPAPVRDDISIATQWAAAAGALGVPFAGALPPLGTNESRATARGSALIHPGSGSPSKNWPLNRFIELGRELKSQGHRVVWIRGPAETDFPAVPTDFEVLATASLADLAANLGAAALFVGNDSGVSHLAAAVGAPTIALFGPTSELVWRPDGPRVRTLRSPRGDLTDLSVSDVRAAIFNRL